MSASGRPASGLISNDKSAVFLAIKANDLLAKKEGPRLGGSEGITFKCRGEGVPHLQRAPSLYQGSHPRIQAPN